MNAIQSQMQDYLQEWFKLSKVGISIAEIDESRPLWPTELTYVVQAVPERRVEFSTGRHCARQALRQLGLPYQAIPVGTWREPLWPQGVIGSITHEREICIALALFKRPYQGVGIDLMRKHLTDENDLSAWILTSQEKSQLAACSLVNHTSLVFSIKESVIKVVSSMAGRFIDLREIQVLHLHDNVFTAQCTGYEGKITGHWVAVADLWLTAAKIDS